MVHRRYGAEEVAPSPPRAQASPARAARRRAASPGFRRGVFLLLAPLFFSGGCSPSPDAGSVPSSQPLVIGVPEGNVESPEIGIGQLASQLTLEALTHIGVDGRALPRLAASWRWEGDLRLRLRLRNDVVLHDGTRLDAQLAAEKLATAIARGATASYPALKDVTAAIPDGRFDLVLDVSRPSSLLPEDLTVLLEIPAGPYRPVVTSDAGIELERFDRYYMGTAPIPRVILKPLGTLRTTWASLLRGELDFVFDVPPDAADFIRSEQVRTLSVKRWYQYAMAFNSRRGPLQSPAVRRALNMAVDRQALVDDVFRGAGSPSSGPLWPEYWAADASVGQYAFAPDQAAALLDSAGYPLRTSAGAAPAARFRITCLVPENFSVVERIALRVQKDLFNVGVDVRFHAVPLREFGRLVSDGEFDAALLDMISGPTPGRAYMFWASARRFEGAYNVFGYENPDAERLFDFLRTSRNEAAVRSATTRLQRVLLDDPPALFLAWTERLRAIRQEFAFPDEPGVDPVFSLWRWTRQPDTVVASRQ